MSTDDISPLHHHMEQTHTELWPLKRVLEEIGPHISLAYKHFS